jgi:hypothetical protein
MARVQEAAIGVLLDLQTESSLSPGLVREIQSLIDESQKLLEEAGRKQQEQFASKQRAYQGWALEQLRPFDPDNDKGWHYDAALRRINEKLASFRSPQSETEWDVLVEFPGAENVLTKTLGLSSSFFRDVEGGHLTVEKQTAIYKAASSTLGWTNNVNIELAYLVVREAMIKYLVPINVSLLDPPVAQLYQKAFSAGWEKLEGRDDQLEVAKGTARVRKKPLE